MLTPLEIAQKFFPNDVEKRKELMADIKRFDNKYFTSQDQMEQALADNRTLLETICMKNGIPAKDMPWVLSEVHKFCLFKVERDEFPVSRTAAFAGVERWIINAKAYLKKPTQGQYSQQQPGRFGNGVVI